MHLIRPYLILLLHAGKRRDIAADAALGAVDEDVNAVIVFGELVEMFGVFERFLGVVVAGELEGFVHGGEAHAVLAADGKPTRVAVIAVFLGDEVVVLEVCHGAGIDAERRGGLPVAVVLMRSSCVELHIRGGVQLHLETEARQTEEGVHASHGDFQTLIGGLVDGFELEHLGHMPVYLHLFVGDDAIGLDDACGRFFEHI